MDDVQNSSPESENQYEMTKENRINFPFIIFKHILLISKLRGEVTTGQGIDEKVFSVLESINCLEDLIFPYIDNKYIEDVKQLKEEDTSWSVQGDILFVAHKDKAFDYARFKLQCIMSLLRRTNLLPEERADPDREELEI